MSAFARLFASQTGDTLRGTWNFTNGETDTTVINSQGTFNSTIETLQSQRFEWLGSAGTYGIMLDSVKYNTDGSYTETDQFGNVYTGTWMFTNNMTGTIVHNSMGTFSSNIELLDSTRYEWYDGLNHYGELVPR